MSDYTRSTVSTINGVNAETQKIQTAVNSKMDTSGGAFTGTVDMNEQRLINLPDATDPSEAMPLGQGLVIQEAAETAALQAVAAAARAETAAAVAVAYPEGTLAGALAVGTANVGGGKPAVSLRCIKDLQGIVPNEDLVYTLQGYYEDTTVGGGGFVWEATCPYSNHNGGTVIAPPAIAAWDGTRADIAAILNWTPTGGVGCWVRVVNSTNWLSSNFGISGTVPAAGFNALTLKSQNSQVAIDFDFNVNAGGASASRSYINWKSSNGCTVSNITTYDASGFVSITGVKFDDCVRILRPSGEINSLSLKNLEITNTPEGLIATNGALANEFTISNVDVFDIKFSGVAATSTKTFCLYLANNVENASISKIRINDVYAAPLSFCDLVYVGVEEDEILSTKNVNISDVIIQDCGRVGSYTEDDLSFGVRCTGVNINISNIIVRNLTNGDPVYAKGIGVHMSNITTDECDEGGVSIKGVNAAGGPGLNEIQSEQNSISQVTVTNSGNVEGGAVLLYGTITGSDINVKTGGTDIGSDGIVLRSLETPLGVIYADIALSNCNVSANRALLLQGVGNYTITGGNYTAYTNKALDMRTDGISGAPTSVSVTGANLTVRDSGSAVGDTSTAPVGRLQLTAVNTVSKTFNNIYAKEFEIKGGSTTIEGLNDTAAYQWLPQVAGAKLSVDTSFVSNISLPLKTCIVVQAGGSASPIESIEFCGSIGGTSGVQRALRLNGTTDMSAVKVSDVICTDGLSSLVENFGIRTITSLMVTNNIAPLSAAIYASPSATTGSKAIISHNIGSATATSGTFTFSSSIIDRNI